MQDWKIQDQNAGLENMTFLSLFAFRLILLFYLIPLFWEREPNSLVGSQNDFGHDAMDIVI